MRVPSRWRLAVGVTAASVLLGAAPASAATARAPAVHVVVTSRPATVTATGTTAHPTDRVVVKGHVVPKSGRVVLQRRSGKRWLDVTAMRVGKRGAFTLIGHQVPVGRQTLRVVRAAAGKVKAVATRTFVVTVRAPKPITKPVPPARPVPVPTAPAPTAPAPTPPTLAPAPPVSPTCTTTWAGDSSRLEAYTVDVLGYVGDEFAGSIGVFDNDSPWTAAVAGALPPGVTQHNGVFSGVPTQAGVFRFNETVSDAAGDTVSLPVCLQFAEPLRLATTTMPTASVGQPYDQPLPLTGGFLPLNLDSRTAQELSQDGFFVGQSLDLRFTPGIPGARTVSLQFTDSMQHYLSLAVTVPVGPPPTSPRTWHVPGDASTVQAAIDLASPGDSVLVAPGTYHGDVDFQGKDIAVRSSGGPSVTVLDGSGTRAVVSFHHEESRDAVLDGFTIRGGAGVNSVDSGNGRFVGEGGGVDIEWASPTVEHNVVIDNTGGNGAGVSVSQGSSLILSNDIAGNTATVTNSFGGALFVADTYQAQVIGNTLENTDWRYGDGGGAYLSGEGLLFQDNVVRGNAVRGDTTGEGAAGLFIVASPGMRIVDDLVSGNVGFDAVVVSANHIALQLTGLTIADNSGVGLLLADNYERVTVKDTVITGTPNPVSCGTTSGFDNESQPGVFDHVDSAGAAVPPACGSFSAGVGDTTVVPTFDPGGYVPAAGSALVDAGAVDPALPDTDLAGNPRVVDGNHDGTATVDIGALERQ
jgi:hypothetical protein